MQKKRILSGIQPTGRMHLGNFLGAVSNWVKLQETYQAYYMIADLHALTTVYEQPAALKEDTFELAVDLLAAGIDPEKSCLFVQSDVPEHSELHLIFSMITPIAWLQRVPSYKDKMDQVTDKDLHTYGFLGYPVLQAADILLYQAHAVPVGKDQLPHLELTREIVRRFHHLYGELFPEPEGLLTPFPVLPGIDGRKMSKTYGNVIPVSATEPETIQLVMKMFTDPKRIKRTDVGHPDVCPVFAYHEVFLPKSEQEAIATACKQATIGCVDCKKRAASSINTALQPFRAKRVEILKHPERVMAVLKQGAERAQQSAKKTLALVKNKIGLMV